MPKKTIAKLFRNGRSQAVRLPKEFRFEGDSVRVRRVGGGILLEPVISDIGKWFAELDRFQDEPFFIEGRRQPEPPRRSYLRAKKKAGPSSLRSSPRLRSGQAG